MNVFQSVPDDLFSVLASPNRVLYADALEILYQAYQDSLRTRIHRHFTPFRRTLYRYIPTLFTLFSGVKIDALRL